MWVNDQRSRSQKSSTHAVLTAFALMSLPLLCLPLNAAAETPNQPEKQPSRAQPTTPLDLKADHLTLDPETGRAVFTGHVTARQGDLQITCDRLEARQGKAGDLEGLVAHGQVQITSKGLTARATEATFSENRGEIVLTGDPRVQRGRAWLSGRRIVYRVSDGRVTVEQARGRMDAPALQLPALQRAALAGRQQ